MRAVTCSIDLHGCRGLLAALLRAESLAAFEAPVHCLLFTQVCHASETAIVFGRKWLVNDPSVDYVSIAASRALEAHGDFAAASASNHLLFVGDLVPAVETVAVQLFGSARDIQLVPIVADLLNHVLVIAKVGCLQASVRLMRLESLNSCLLGGHFNLIIDDSGLFQFFLLASLQLLCNLFFPLLVHEFVAAHKLISHCLHE